MEKAIVPKWPDDLGFRVQPNQLQSRNRRFNKILYRLDLEFRYVALDADVVGSIVPP